MVPTSQAMSMSCPQRSVARLAEGQPRTVFLAPLSNLLTPTHTEVLIRGDLFWQRASGEIPLWILLQALILCSHCG